jgi:DNA-nicking Smr family endonuclease
MSRKLPPNDSKDDPLWVAVTKDVKPLKAKKKIAKISSEIVPAKPSKTPIKVIKAEIASTPQFGLKPSSINTRHAADKSSFQSDTSTTTKLKKGNLPIDGMIDLHGLTLPKAHSAFLKFVAAHVKQRSRVLLVITGKGKDGKGVIRASIKQWVDEAPFSYRILKITEASSDHGGSGAFYLLLRQKH